MKMISNSIFRLWLMLIFFPFIFNGRKKSAHFCLQLYGEHKIIFQNMKLILINYILYFNEYKGIWRSGCQQLIKAGMTNSALRQLIYKRRTSSFSSSILKSILTTTPRPVVLNKTSSMEPAKHANNDNYWSTILETTTHNP